MKVAPLPGKVAVYDRSTGAMLLRWPVDARTLCASGEYSMEPPVDEALAPVTDAPVAPPPRRRR